MGSYLAQVICGEFSSVIGVLLHGLRWAETGLFLHGTLRLWIEHHTELKNCHYCKIGLTRGWKCSALHWVGCVIADRTVVWSPPRCSLYLNNCVMRWCWWSAGWHESHSASGQLLGAGGESPSLLLSNNNKTRAPALPVVRLSWVRTRYLSCVRKFCMKPRCCFNRTFSECETCFTGSILGT